MSNVAPIINELLKSHDSRLIQPPRFSVDNLNAFLREAYQINKGVQDLIAYLRSIRQSYLSGAPPPRRRHNARSDPSHSFLTNEERDQIDADAKATLRDLHAAVNRLSQIEKARQDADAAIGQKRRRKMAFGALGQWASGGGATSKSPAEVEEEAKATGVKLHREGVIWYLQRKLEECGIVQSTMMEIRITREVEKSKSVLYKIRGSAQVPVYGGDSREMVNSTARGTTKSRQPGVSVEDMEQRTQGQQFDEEQMQLFAQENQDMLKQYEDRLDQVRTAERSLIEISELQSTLVGNLEVQSAHIDQLTQDSFQVTENVGKGNKELKKASEKKSTAKVVFYSTSGLCAFLIAWDLIF